MADGEAAFRRVFAFQNMNIGAANRRCRKADERVERPHVRDRFVIENDPVGFDENGGLRHFGHLMPSL